MKNMSTVNFHFLVCVHLPGMDGLLNGCNRFGPKGKISTGNKPTNYKKKHTKRCKIITAC